MYILIRGVMFNVVVMWVRDGLKIILLGGFKKKKNLGKHKPGLMFIPANHWFHGNGRDRI